jgi:hypothetical protein
MKARTLFTIALLALDPSGIQAAVLFQPEIQFSTGYDSNVLGGANGSQGDGVIRTGPLLKLEKTEGQVTFDARYRGVYEDFYTLDGLGDYSNFASFQGGWKIDGRSELDVSDQFARAFSVNSALVLGVAPDATPQVELQRQLSTRNVFNANYERNLGARWRFTAFYSNQFNTFEREELFPNSTNTGSAQIVRTLDRKNAVGIGFSVIGQDFGEATFENDIANVSINTSSPNSFENSITASGLDSQFYNGFLFWSHQLTRGLSFSIQGGPALVAPDSPAPQVVLVNPLYQSGSQGFLVDPTPAQILNIPGFPPIVVSPGCQQLANGQSVLAGNPAQSPLACQPLRRDPTQPAFIGGVPNTPNLFPVADPAQQPTVKISRPSASSSLTYFGDVNLTQRWQFVTARLSYRRTASSTSGLGSSTTLDLVTGVVSWEPTPDWQLNLVGNVSRRNSSSDTIVSALVVVPDASLGGAARALDFAETGQVADRVEVRQFLAAGRVTRRLTRRLRLTADFSVLRQETIRELGGNAAKNRFQGTVGFVYDFDPIQL